MKAIYIPWDMIYDNKTDNKTGEPSECKFAMCYLHTEIAILYTVNLCNVATTLKVWVQLMNHLHTSVEDYMTTNPDIVVLLFGRCLFPRQLWVPLWGCSLQRYSRWHQNMRRRCAHNWA